jgi:hypothetical protein
MTEEVSVAVGNPPWSVSPNPEITGEDFLEILKDVGLRGYMKRTGHFEYKRVFVIDKKGVTIGRATIYRGFYSHTKWYGENQGFHVKESFFVEARLQTGRVPTEDEYRAAAKTCRERAQKRYEEKLRWREENPRPNGKPRKRLEKPNYYNGLMAELLAEMNLEA